MLAIAMSSCGRLSFDPISGVSHDGGDPDSSSGAGDAVTSGSRLVATYWVSSDGTARFASFYDPVTASHCDFRRDAAGTLRCFPFDATADVYADGSCTVPAIRTSNTCLTPQFARRQIYNTSTQSYHTAAYSPGTTLAGAYILGLACYAPNDGARYHALGAMAADDTFVAAQEISTPLDSGFARVELVADDGSRMQNGVTFQGVRCTLQRMGASTGMCVPVEPSFVSDAAALYADAACTVEVVSGLPTPPPSYVSINRSRSAPCRPRRFARTGAQQTLTQAYYRSASGTCASVTATAATYTFVTDMTSSLPVLTRVIDPGTTRLRTSAYLTPGGSRLEDQLYDTGLGAPCSPTTDGSGVTTCAPLTLWWTTEIWKSSNCAGPGPEASIVCNGADTQYELQGYIPRSYATCEGTGVGMVTLTTPLATQAAYVKLLDNCISMDLTDATVYDTATVAYDPSRLVRLTRM